MSRTAAVPPVVPPVAPPIASPPAGWNQRWRHSLKLRLTTMFVLLALAMAVVFLGSMQRVLSVGWRDAARPLVTDYIDRLVADLGSPPDIARAQALAVRLPIAVRIEGPLVNWRSDGDQPKPENRRSDNRRQDSHQHDNRFNDWLSRSTVDGHRVSFGLAPTPWHREGRRGMVWITLALLLLLIAPAYLYVRRLLRPLDDIRLGAERFGSGQFDEPIPLRRRDELGDLAQRINTMAHDLEGMLDAKRTLLLAISHELRSPLTRARLNAELLPVTPGGTGPGEGERSALLRDLNEMRDLISDLLESERLASPHAALQREPTDLAALVRETVADRPDAGAVQLDLPAGLPLPALDRTRIRLLLRNLLDNALRYSAGAAQSPRVSLALEAGGVRLAVRDFGPGVNAAQLARLTEPFYRTDSARQRATGGAGLGLHLCRRVAEAHGSALKLQPADPGLEVSLLLKT